MTRAGGHKKAKLVGSSSSQPKSKKATKCATSISLEKEPQPLEVAPMELEGETQIPADVEHAENENQVVDDDIEQEMDEHVPAIIDKPLGSNILKALTIHRGKAVPEVPLCRCLINTRVRELRLDLLDLKRSFIHEGYVPIKGNHRTASWMEVVKEVWSRDKERHVRIRAEFIDPEPKHEVKLLASLQRFNLMNENAIVLTSLRDYLQYTSTLCSCDVDDFMEDFTPVDKMAIEKSTCERGFGRS
ncbi:hypothetical protein GOP47_0008276 [Adiantum capillus-veneris]|uniref:Uncharacterized protein n=1 Tax=Adiantum capillus-veneris TaxID=13818 RepID=A0A9D4ZKA5_ADICA|nr:hypothetical protein GOP47_0008276 [Adiantum capillus-veneris]